MKKDNLKNKIELKNIVKTFLSGQIVANDKISISFKAGEIHSIIGENGSGKSTLMLNLFGLYNIDSGDIFIDGKKVNMYEQGAAKKYKIGMVHQHFHLVDNFTILQNIIIGQEKKYSNGPFLNKAKLLEHFKKICENYNIDLDPNILVKKLNIGDRQKVEILKTLWEEKDVIIFDEPTATLSVKEIDLFLKILQKLKESNILIIFVSHKLQEVKLVSDRISILKRGKFVGTFENDSKLTISEISKLMIGKTVEIKFDAPKASKNVLLKVENLNYVTSRGFQALRDISFDIKEDEIFGLAGIEGNGQEEILNIIAGLKKPGKGSKILFKDQENLLKSNSSKNNVSSKEKSEISLEEEKELSSNKKNENFVKKEEEFINITKMPIRLRNRFMAHVPIDRFEHGILLNKSIKFNSIISNYGNEKFSQYYDKKREKSYIMSDKKISDWCKKIVESQHVEGVKNINNPIRNLSGGNQQKFVFGREMLKTHSLFIAGHPTRGLDVNAINNIYTNLIENSKSKATLLYSLEITELIEVCTRIAILYKGQIVKIIEPKKYSFDSISRMMVGEVND